VELISYFFCQFETCQSFLFHTMYFYACWGSYDWAHSKRNASCSRNHSKFLFFRSFSFSSIVSDIIIASREWFLLRVHQSFSEVQIATRRLYFVSGCLHTYVDFVSWVNLRKLDSKRNTKGCVESVVSPFDSLMNKREESNWNSTISYE
jgi:hypothetical protein